MKKLYVFTIAFCIGLSIQAQDDIYDAPEPYQPRVYTSETASAPSQQYSDGRDYENLDENYNPNFDYRYSRSLRRMYDPYYIMPSSAYISMYSYPQFASFYTPYWGSGFSITIGNNPWGSYWGNPWNWGYGWNGWNSWNNWGWNNWNYGWNNWGWNNTWCNSYAYYGGWNSWNYGGWNNWGYGGGYRQHNYRRSNYINVAGNHAYSNTQLPQRNRYPRANGRYQNPNNAGSTFRRNGQYNNSSSQTPSRFSNGGGATFNNPTTNVSPPSNNGGSIFGGRSASNNSSWSGGGSSNNNSNGNVSSGGNNRGSSGGGRSGGSAPRGGRF